MVLVKVCRFCVWKLRVGYGVVIWSVFVLVCVVEISDRVLIVRI